MWEVSEIKGDEKRKVIRYVFLIYLFIYKKGGGLYNWDGILRIGVIV